MFRLVCPKCLRTVDVVSVNVAASCTHGKDAGRFNPPIAMIPIAQLATKETAS